MVYPLGIFVKFNIREPLSLLNIIQYGHSSKIETSKMQQFFHFKNKKLKTNKMVEKPKIKVKKFNEI